MKQLTRDQLNFILTWLDSWEQLKGTAIPVRFLEDFREKKNPPKVKH